MALAPLPALKVADLISPHADVLVDNSSDSVIDEGWRKIAVDLFSTWAAIVRQTPGARLSIRAVTERLGALRVICEAAAGLAPGYLDLHEVRHLQREAEILSLRTCGRCGEPGVLRCTPEGFATKCDTHADGIVGRLRDAERYLPLPAEVVQNALQSHGNWLICDGDASLEVPRGWLPLFVELLVRLRDLPGTGCGFRLLEARGICGRLGIRLAHDPEGLPFHHFLRWRETLLAAGDDAMFRCDVCGGPAWIRVTRRGGGTPAPRCDAHADMQRWQSRQWRIYDYSEDPLALVSSIRPQWTVEAIRGTGGASAGADADRDPTPLLGDAGALALYDVQDVAAALGLANDDGDEHYCDAEPSPPDTEQQGRLRRIFERGPAARWRQLARPDRAMVDRLEALADRVPHLEALTSLIKRHLLAGIHMQMPIRLPPLLVVGPPGVGKTFFMTELARVLNVPFRNQPISATSHADSIGGSHGAWRNASVGLVARTLLGEKVANPLIFIDEFDKVASEGLASDLYRPFYSLLEPVGARQFVDAFLTFPMDASQILWALAANDVSAIPTPILNRLTIVTVDAPDDAQMRKVASSVYADCNHRRGTFFPEQPSPTLVDRLAGLEPRRMRIAIDNAMTSAAAAGRSEILTEDLPDQRPPKRTRIGFV